MGATFAAVVALRAAQENVPLRHQLLVYPFTDLTLSHPSVERYAEGHLLTRALLDWFLGHYVDPGDRTHPWASPLCAPEVAGAASATILLAECDPVRDEGMAYAEKLRAGGVPVEVHEYEGMIHVFFVMSGVIDRADQAMDDATAALRRALA
jgi:acetyl esterase